MIDTEYVTRNINLIIKETGPYEAIKSLCDEIDRLRGEPIIKQPQIDTILSSLRGEQQTPPMGTTVEVRFPGLIDGNGEVIISQYHRDKNGDHHCAIHDCPRATKFWITATLPVPADVEVVAKVEGE